MTFFVDVLAWFAAPAHWLGPDGIPTRFGEHLALSGAALAIAGVMALPVGIALGHFGRGGAFALGAANGARAIPSFALLVLALQLFGLGAPPALVALAALAVPPMLLNAYVAVHEVDADVREAGRAMGMGHAQLLFRVELPVAIPLLMAGVRTAAVLVVATAPLAALVAFGGLGRYIIDGILLRDFVRVFAGAVLVVAASLSVELALAILQRSLTPTALRRPPATDALAGAARGMGMAR